MDERVLEPGWAGVLTLAEAQFIAANLATNRALRRQWKFRKRIRYPLNLIAERAFPEDLVEAVRNMRVEQSRAHGPSEDERAAKRRARGQKAAYTRRLGTAGDDLT